MEDFLTTGDFPEELVTLVMGKTGCQDRAAVVDKLKPQRAALLQKVCDIQHLKAYLLLHFKCFGRFGCLSLCLAVKLCVYLHRCLSAGEAGAGGDREEEDGGGGEEAGEGEAPGAVSHGLRVDQVLGRLSLRGRLALRVRGQSQHHRRLDARFYCEGLNFAVLKHAVGFRW